MAVVVSEAEVREILEYMEQMENVIDGEWGSCMNIPEFIEANRMHDMYYVLKKRLGIPRNEQVTEEA